MYYSKNPFEVIIPAADLKPGMRVCVPRSVTYGWHQYTGLTIYKPCTIKRVTPKKTKVICEDGSEYFTKETTFLQPVHEMNIENEREPVISTRYVKPSVILADSLLSTMSALMRT